MNLNDARIGQTVRAASPADMLHRCSTYHTGIPVGVIVDIDDHYAASIAVKWIDYHGPQTETYMLQPAHLVADSPANAPKGAIDRNPSIEIRDLKLDTDATHNHATGLKFHTVDDANAALHAIAAAKEAFEPITAPDTTNPIAGALAVSVHWSLHTNIYRLELIPGT